jgi:hypothetical protein
VADTAAVEQTQATATASALGILETGPVGDRACPDSLQIVALAGLRTLEGFVAGVGESHYLCAVFLAWAGLKMSGSATEAQVGQACRAQRSIAARK